MKGFNNFTYICCAQVSDHLTVVGIQKTEALLNIGFSIIPRQ